MSAVRLILLTSMCSNVSKTNGGVAFLCNVSLTDGKRRSASFGFQRKTTAHSHSIVCDGAL
jgi:hypothetical protein